MDQIVGARHTRRVVAVFLALSAVLTALVAVSSAATQPAQAAPPDELLASDNPYNWTPKVLNGRVSAIKQVGNVVVVGGTFTQIQNTGSNQPVLNQSYLFAYNATTGRIIPEFSPTADGQVNAIVPSPSGTAVYVAGAFGQVNGVGGRVAELRLSDGSRTSFRAQGINNEVYDMRLVGQRLFIAGSFVTVQQASDPGMSVLDAATGTRLTDYDVPDFTGVGWDPATFTTVRKIDVTPDGSKLVAIGNFNAVGGQSRIQIAMLDLGPSAATVAGWTTDRFRAQGTTTGSSWCSGSFDSYMRDVDFAPNGNFFVVVTTGAYRSGRLCDTASRWETNRSGPQTETWADYTGGDTFWAVEVTGPVVYVGGHMRWFNNPYRGDNAGPGAVPRQGIAALDSRNGLPFSWNPGRKRGVGLFDFDVTNDQVWAGSDTAKWAGETRPRLAGFPFDNDATPLPADKVASLPADVVSLDSPATGVSQTTRNFDGSTILGTANETNAADWSQVRGAVMIDDTVYMGWANGTFQSRTYDGSSFGSPQTLNLYANGYTTNTSTYTLFGTEIPRITGMFYDRQNARLYYTLRPEGTQAGGFFYRYFTPESGIVGAQRFSAVGGSLIGANSSGSTTPQGMFMADGKVYFSDPTGVLKVVDFTPGVDGAAGGVSGTVATADSSADWRTNAMFTSNAPTSTGPNTSPVAALDVSCAGLDCTFDASDSSDPDGSVVSYAFDFGDGDTSAASPNATAQHTYATGGTYNVSVTVTDNRGGTDTESQSISPAPITSSIDFRVSGAYAGGSRSTHNWTIPNGVAAGDQMILAVSGSTAQTLTTPAGWTVLDQRLDTDIRTVVFGKVADPSDAGSAVSFVWSGATRTSAVLAAYSGVGGTPTAVGAVETTARATHTTPGVTVPVDGAWVLSYWADKSTATTGWAAPGGQTVREVAVDPALVGTATTRVTGLFTDDDQPSAAGARPGLTATASASTGKATMFTIVLSPAP